MLSKFLEVACWLLPASRRKNALLRHFGHRISESASIGPTIALGVGRFEVGDAVRVNTGNVFKGLSLVRLDQGAWIASWNWITAAPEFQAVDAFAGTLHMQRGSKVGSRNYLDCSGTIVIRSYGWVGGNRTYLQTHEPDLVNERQTAGRIVVGHHSLVHSCAVLLKGAVLPDKSVLETSSTLLAAVDLPRRGIYSGSPARWIGDTEGDWFERTELVMTDPIIEGTMGPEGGPPTVAPVTPSKHVENGERK